MSLHEHFQLFSIQVCLNAFYFIDSHDNISKIKKKTAIKCTGYISHCVKHVSTMSQWNLNQTSHHKSVESQTIYLFNWIVQKTNSITYHKMQLVEWIWDKIWWFLAFWISSADEWCHMFEKFFVHFFREKNISHF